MKDPPQSSPPIMNKFVSGTPRGQEGLETERGLLDEEKRGLENMIEGTKPLALSTNSTQHRSCSYCDCIIVQNEVLEEVIKIKRKQNQLQAKATRELEKRLKVTYSFSL